MGLSSDWRGSKFGFLEEAVTQFLAVSLLVVTEESLARSWDGVREREAELEAGFLDRVE